MVEILAEHRAGREGQCLTIQGDSCQELASGVMQRISIVGISMSELWKNDMDDHYMVEDAMRGPERRDLFLFFAGGLGLHAVDQDAHVVDRTETAQNH